MAVCNNNNNTLIYIAPACRMTSEALADSSSRATECSGDDLIGAATGCSTRLHSRHSSSDGNAVSTINIAH